VLVLAELTFGAEKIRMKLGDTTFTRQVEALRKQLEVEPLRESFVDRPAALAAGRKRRRPQLSAPGMIMVASGNRGSEETAPNRRVRWGPAKTDRRLEFGAVGLFRSGE